MNEAWFAGLWIFDPTASQFALPPARWVMRLGMKDSRIQVDEEITRAAGIIRIQVDAASDGAFHPFSGSPLADEIAYFMEGVTITGKARKNGIVSFVEVMTLREYRVLEMQVELVVEDRRIELGTARFYREEVKNQVRADLAHIPDDLT